MRMRIIGTGGRTRARIVIFPWLKSIARTLTVGLRGLIFDFEFSDGSGSIRTPSRPGIVCYAFYSIPFSISVYLSKENRYPRRSKGVTSVRALASDVER